MSIKGYELVLLRELKAYWKPLELYNFDLILKMDWLGTYRAQMDCFSKIVTL
jgi:hypothetical protein